MLAHAGMVYTGDVLRHAVADWPYDMRPKHRVGRSNAPQSRPVAR